MEAILVFMRLLLASIASLAAASAAPAQSPPPRVVGYFPSWAIYGRNYHVPDVPAAKLTHLNYAFANITSGRIALGDRYADIDRFYPGDSWAPGALRGSFRRMQLMKQQHPHVKTLISVGGWTWSGNFSDAVLTPQARATFAQSCVDFVVLYDFDGVDVDWEYPVGGGLATNVTRPQDKQNYTLFLRELRQQLDARGQQLGRTYLLTIAAPADPAIAQHYEVAQLVPILDWFNLMTYDLHGPWVGVSNPVTNFNTPLHPASDDPTPEPYRSSFTVAAAVDLYQSLGVPPEKLHVGLAFYGRGYGNVQTGLGNGMFAPYSGPAPFGTWENGVFDWTNLRDHYLNRNGFTVFRHPDARTPWVHSPTQRVTISFDDPRSIREKAWFAKAEGLGGAMFWELSADRDANLLDVVDQELRGRPWMVAPVRDVPVTSPIAVSMSLKGGSAAAGRNYLVLGSSSGRWPGTALPGGALPLNLDWFSDAALAIAGSAIFTGATGVLDARGDAVARFDWGALAPLPPVVLGMEFTFAGWVAGGPTLLPGLPTNPVDVHIVR